MSRSPTEMEIRVAKVLFATALTETGGVASDEDNSLWVEYIPMAVAAIRAMHEPTSGMTCGAHGGVWTPEDTLAWQTMIEAASPPL